MPAPAPTTERQRAEAIHAACTRYFSHHVPRTPQQVLADLAATTPADLESDIYGSGPLIADFEAQIAALFGKEAAVFMPSGTMAQQIALRIWAERSGNFHVGFHPTCHLEIHEQGAYRMLHGLRATLIGNRYRLFTLDDLQAVRERLGTLLIELPQREIGGALPAWEDLVAQVAWAHDEGMIVHLDGARVWESQPYYGRSYAEIAALFDTMYVSFYKILDGITGAMLLGPEDVIDEARVWQRRHGGNLVHLYPFVLSAQRGLEAHLPHMGDYHARALEMAAALSALDGIEVTPNPPHTNMFHAYFQAEPKRLADAALDVSEESGVWLYRPVRPAQVPGWCLAEFVMGSAAQALSGAEIGELFAEVMRRATM
jgi:threonine aldolase